MKGGYMEQIIRSLLLFVLIILEFILFFILIGTAAPKILGSYCSVKKTSDRGLKKFVYPDGRAIAYEPHPSVRKYVPRYLLFTEDGYKYISCKLDESVNKIKYSVVMFNNRNRVVDVIDAFETKMTSSVTTPVMLHQDTSYVSLIPDTVNKTRLKHPAVLCCHFWQLAIYAAVVGAISFLHMFYLKKMVSIYDAMWVGSGIADGVSDVSFIFPAFAIAAIAAFIAFRHNRKKGIRWSK